MRPSVEYLGITHAIKLQNVGIRASWWIVNLGASLTPGIYRFGTNPEAGIIKRGAISTPRLSFGP
jgi:hypothetical protein